MRIINNNSKQVITNDQYSLDLPELSKLCIKEILEKQHEYILIGEYTSSFTLGSFQVPSITVRNLVVIRLTKALQVLAVEPIRKSENQIFEAANFISDASIFITGKSSSSANPTDKCSMVAIVDVSKPVLGSISGILFHDANVNGLMDDNDPFGQLEVTITLLDEDRVPVLKDALGYDLISISPDVNGAFEFLDLLPGNYRVQISVASELQRTKKAISTLPYVLGCNVDPQTGISDLVSTSSNTKIVAGYYTNGYVNGRVWLDYQNPKDGILPNHYFDENDEGLMNIKVILQGYENGLHKEYQTYTSNNPYARGYYSFPSVAPGRYLVTFYINQPNILYPNTQVVYSNIGSPELASHIRSVVSNNSLTILFGEKWLDIYSASDIRINFGIMQNIENNPINNLESEYRVQNKSLNILNLRPNPTSDNLIIQSPEVIKDMVIYSVEGKIIKTFRNLLVSTYDVDVSNYINGIYRVEIITKDGNRLNKNFIKTN